MSFSKNTNSPIIVELGVQRENTIDDFEQYDLNRVRTVDLDTTQHPVKWSSLDLLKTFLVFFLFERVGKACGINVVNTK